MGSMMIVVMKPGAITFGPGFFAFISDRVRPFLREGAIETLHLSVGLRPVGASESVLHGRSQRFRKRVRPIAGPVVCHHSGDSHSGVGEERAGSLPERGCALLLLVSEDL